MKSPLIIGLVIAAAAAVIAVKVSKKECDPADQAAPCACSMIKGAQSNEMPTGKNPVE